MDAQCALGSASLDHCPQTEHVREVPPQLVLAQRPMQTQLFAHAEGLLPGQFNSVNSLLQTRMLSRRQTKVTDWTRQWLGISAIVKINGDQLMSTEFRPLTTQVLCAAELHYLNLIDTSWSALILIIT